MIKNGGGMLVKIRVAKLKSDKNFNPSQVWTARHDCDNKNEEFFEIKTFWTWTNFLEYFMSTK